MFFELHYVKFAWEWSDKSHKAGSTPLRHGRGSGASTLRWEGRKDLESRLETRGGLFGKLIQSEIVVSSELYTSGTLGTFRFRTLGDAPDCCGCPDLAAFCLCGEVALILEAVLFNDTRLDRCKCILSRPRLLVSNSL